MRRWCGGRWWCGIGSRVVSLAAAAALVACAGSPPPQWLYLPSQGPDASAAAPAPVPRGGSGLHYQLLLPVRVPEYLDRTDVLLPSGATLSPLAGWRWAEPLGDAVPRLLRADLAALLGPDRLWSSPLPPGAVVHRQWRVEILGFEADAARRTVRLQARWTLADLRGGQPPRSGGATLSVDIADATPGALAAAHRQAVHRLAVQLLAEAEPR